MLSKLRTKHPILFAIIVYLVFMFGMGIFAGIFNTVFKIALPDQEALSGNLTVIGAELGAALLLCLVLWRTGKLKLLSKKGKGFVGSLAVGAYVFLLMAFFFFTSISDQAETGNLAVNFTSASFTLILAMIAVGLTEELTARALMGETFLEHFGTERSGVIKAVIVSGVIFGLMHLTNIFDGDAATIAIQVFSSMTGGFLFGAIYFRTGNIWSVIIIHGLYDAFASTQVWLFNGGVEVETGAVAYTPETIAIPVIMGLINLAVAFFLLRKKRIGEVKQNWPELSEKAPAKVAKSAE